MAYLKRFIWLLKNQIKSGSDSIVYNAPHTAAHVAVVHS